MSIKKYHKSKNLLDMSDSTFRVSTLNCSYSKGILALSGTILEVGSTNQNWKDYLSFYLDAGTYSLNTPPELCSNYGRYLRKYDDDSLLISSDVTEVTLTERTRVYIGLYIANKTLNDQLAFMCNEGSSALPYEPYDPEVWHSVPYRKYGTETDSITTLPATIIGDGTPITSYTVKGNMGQSGTPTPSSPIYPSECGEKTENLFDKNATDTTNGYIDGKFIRQPDGAMISDTDYAISQYMEVTENTTYCWTFSLTSTRTHSNPTVEYLDETKTRLSIATHGYLIKQFNFITPANCKYVRVSVYKPSISEAMLTSGSTAPTSYIPYGYKLPITLGSTTTDIYLGEVQSTRRVKKLVLTGEENWSLWSSGQPDVERYYYKWGKTTPSDYGLICTHFPFIWSDGNFEHVRLGGSNRDDFVIFISKTIAQTLADFKSYLAAQYAAGTPVISWYVLAEPETGIVNEPIRKIGDYVDSVSGTNLATSGTAQELNIETTLKPSEVDMTYHGWHEHDDTKYST